MIGIPFAAGLLFPIIGFGLPPHFAGLAMAFSSISVVLSSLHLRTHKKRTLPRTATGATQRRQKQSKASRRRNEVLPSRTLVASTSK